MNFDNQNIAIIGARDAEHLIREFTRIYRNIHIVCIGDNNTSLQNQTIVNVPILPVTDVVKKYKSKTVDLLVVAVRKGYSRSCLLRQIEDEGVFTSDIVLIKPSVLTYKKHLVLEIDDARQYRQQITSLEQIKKSGKILVHHLETHAADGCNLNCRGCLHFSNLYEKSEFPNLDTIIKDLEYLSKHLEIFQFRILGGEPLLHTNLVHYLEEFRRVLPDTDLALISNGILIPKADPKIYKVMKDNNIGFNLTLYPPTLKMKEMIYEVLDKYGVSYGSHEVETNIFEKYIRLTPAVDSEAYKNCISRGIITLREGRLYKCPTGTYIKRYYEKFDIKGLPYDEGVDIYKNDMNWNELIDRLELQKGPHCDYCSEKHEEYCWSNSGIDVKDWIVE